MYFLLFYFVYLFVTVNYNWYRIFEENTCYQPYYKNKHMKNILNCDTRERKNNTKRKININFVFFFATDYAFFNFNSPTEQQFCLVMIYRRGKGGVDKIKLISPSTAGQGNSLTTWKAFFNNFISPRVRRVLTIT